MGTRSPMRAFLLFLTLAISAPLTAAPQGTGTPPLSVMSFNIRYGTAQDGENHWTRRQDHLLEVIADARADVIGLQEALDDQIQTIVTQLPMFAAIGVGRDDGKTRGEYAAILYRRDRFRVSQAGTFWFSETPDVVASRSWGNTITRICTWARLIDRDGRAFWVYNVHLDHQSQPSRERSADLLATRVAARPAGEPAIVTGDFNAGEDNPAVRRLVSAQGTAAPLLLDTFRALHPSETVVGTFTGFTFGKTDGDKIDYVMVTPDVVVREAAIVRTSRDGRYPSDHFPVVATVQLPAGSAPPRR